MEFKYISPFQYYNMSNPLFAAAVKNNEGVTFLQGIKAGEKEGTFILTGSINAQDYGLVYDGPVDNAIQPDGSNGSGTWYFYPVPQSFKKEYLANGISIYGPENLGNGSVNLVGAYTRNLGENPTTGENPDTVGFYYSGKIDGSTDNYISFQGITKSGKKSTFTFLHSIFNGLVVGNCDIATTTPISGTPIQASRRLESTAFIYNTKTGKQRNIEFPSDVNENTHTAYGIWYNGNGKYTIAGGSGRLPEIGTSKGSDGNTSRGWAYLIDYDINNDSFSNYQEFSYHNGEKGIDFIAHFEGIWSDDGKTYKLPALSSTFKSGAKELIIGSVVTVERSEDSRFNPIAKWEDLEVVSSDDQQASYLTTNNSLCGDVSIGFANYNGDDPVKASFVAIAESTKTVEDSSSLKEASQITA
jgi:hypothetical protein